MREIKFRAWSTYGEHKMVTLDPRNTDDPFESNSLFDSDKWHVMQFTGLYDRDGKEIYEGDIVHHPNGEDYPVGFHNGCFGIVGTIGWGNWHTFSTVSARTDELVVIGNKWEER